MLPKLISHSAQDTFSLYGIQLLDEDALKLLYGFKLEAKLKYKGQQGYKIHYTIIMFPIYSGNLT